MNITKLIIVLLLVLMIILFTYKLKNKEHLTSSNEALQTLVSVYNPTQLTVASAKFNSINSNKMDLSGGILNATNGIFNYLKSNNLDVSSNLTSNTGTFNTITSNNLRGNVTGETARFNNLTFNNLGVSGNINGNVGNFGEMNVSGSLIGKNGIFNNLTGTTGRFNTITSDNLNGNITGETGRFTNLNSTNMNITSNINGNVGIFSEMNVSGSLVGSTGNFNNLTGTTGKFNTITSNNLIGNITGETGRFTNLNSTNMNVSGTITGEIGTFNQINSNNISGNIYGETGRFTNFETSNDFRFTNITGETGRFNNIISSEISGNNYFGNTASFNNLRTNNLNIVNTNFNTIRANTFCFGTNANDCISENSFNLLQLLNSRLYSYMYLPNTITKYGSGWLVTTPQTTIDDQNVIWSDISGYINFSPTIKPTAPIIDISGTTGSKWQIFRPPSILPVDWNGIAGSTLWNGIYIYKTTGMNGIQSDGIGLQIKVPPHPNKSLGQDYSVLWIRLLNERQSYFRIYDMSGLVTRKYFGKHCVGQTSLNDISPDGSTKSDSNKNVIWWPVPIDLSGNSSRNIMLSTFQTGDMWIGGLAFSTNPWNHCLIHANTIFNRVNDSNTSAGLNPDATTINFQVVQRSQYLCKFIAGTQPIIRIPIVNSQRNKILYIVEQNDSWSPSVAGAEINITPNGSTPTWQNLGNFYTTFDNPFARHSNSKIFQKYYGVVIPKEYLPVKNSPNDNFIHLRFTFPAGIDPFYFTDVGTHDVNPFE